MMGDDYQRNSYGYTLPKECIAQEPQTRRDHSRLLVYDKQTQQVVHTVFSCLPDLLAAGDVLVRNVTRVIPSRIAGVTSAGKSVEMTFMKERHAGLWECLAQPAARLPLGMVVRLAGEGLEATVAACGERGMRLLSLPLSRETFVAFLEQYGRMPVPPYIKRAADDNRDTLDHARYQTVYAQTAGAVAAPTAGLHFTEQLFACLREKGVAVADIVLHVGMGTFMPVHTEDIRRHTMHAEDYSISAQTAAVINDAQRQRGRIIAVGTTVVRCLETAADKDGFILPGSGSTNLFIYPGYRFKAVHNMITNFHLPYSTLLMLVSALCGRETVLALYHQAMEQGYRFYSYGDALFVRQA